MKPLFSLKTRLKVVNWIKKVLHITSDYTYIEAALEIDIKKLFDQDIMKMTFLEVDRKIDLQEYQLMAKLFKILQKKGMIKYYRSSGSSIKGSVTIIAKLFVADPVPSHQISFKEAMAKGLNLRMYSGQFGSMNIVGELGDDAGFDNLPGVGIMEDITGKTFKDQDKEMNIGEDDYKAAADLESKSGSILLSDSKIKGKE